MTEQNRGNEIMNTITSIILLPVILPSIALGALAAVIYLSLKLGFTKARESLEGNKPNNQQGE